MIMEEQEQTKDYDFTAIRRPSVETDPTKVRVKPHTSVEQLREQVSVASSQGFQQQTCFDQTVQSRNSPTPGGCGTSSSDNAATKDTKKSDGKSNKEGEMKVEEEEGDSDIIPPSEHGESRVSALLPSVSRSRESAHTGRPAGDDPYQFTMSQSQRERDDLEEIKKDRKVKRPAVRQPEVMYPCTVKLPE